MLKRLLPALACAFGLVALVHCGGGGGDDDDTTLGDVSHLEAGAPTCASTRTCSGGASSSGGKSASSSGHAGSSGTSGTTSSGGATSSTGGPGPTYTRIEPAKNLPTRSQGCGNANYPGAGNRVSVGDGSRSYLTFPPGDYQNDGLHGGDKAGRGYPLLIALHGCQADAQEFSTLGYGSFQDAVGSAGVVVYPEAQNALGGCGWNFNDDQAYLDAVLADAKSQYCIDESRVFLLGFSYGGYMSQVYSCNRPGTIKALVSAASGYPDNWGGSIPGIDVRECGQIPTLIYGRDNDHDEPIGNSIHARDQRVAVNACDASGSAAYWPWNDPDTFGNDAVGCTDYKNCVNGLRTTFCEDPKNLNDQNEFPGSDDSWNHTLWQPYHPPVWAWANNLPD